MKRALVALVVVASLAVGVTAHPVAAQDDRSGVPTQDIIPEPDTGEAPDEAGDRGGGLQLLLLGLVVLALAGGGWHIARQARRGREQRAPR